MKSKHLSAIRIPSLPIEGFVDEEIDGLSAVNFLVGPNNSGKSRLLRGILQADRPDVRFSDWSLEEFRAQIGALASEIGNSWPQGLSGYSEVYRETFDIYKGQMWTKDVDDSLVELLSKLRRLAVQPASSLQYSGVATISSQAVSYLHERLRPHFAKIAEVLDDSPSLTPGVGRLYIPMLRGLRRLNGNDDSDLYLDRTRKDYNVKYQISTGQDFYVRIRDLLLGSRLERDLVAAYEDFLGKEFFQESVELVPHRARDVLTIRIGDADERPLYDLGDGLQSLISITLPLFLSDRPLLVGIEEPEATLHPGYQRRLLEVLLTDERLARHQVAATTHSNHLLDIAGDYDGCSTVAVRKYDSKVLLVVVKPRDRSVLDDLGVRASSVFLTNATIWVEGPVDRKYLRAYLARYMSDMKIYPPFKEDIHYSFMEVGGANVAHYSFVDHSSDLGDHLRVMRLCTNNLLILDGDNKGKRRITRLQEELGRNLILWPGKEIENTIPVELVRRYVASVNSVLDCGCVNADSYERSSKSLGKILDQKFGTKEFSEDATVARKEQLCMFVVDACSSPDGWSLSSSALEVCARIVEFVRDANA